MSRGKIRKHQPPHRERYYPTDAEVEAYVSTQFAIMDAEEAVMSGTARVAITDQVLAAQRESQTAFHRVNEEIQRRDSDAKLYQIDQWGYGLRVFATQFIVAMSAGIEHLCEHTSVGQGGAYGARPIVMVIDPAVAVCQRCLGLPNVMARISALGHQFDGECDRCGRRTMELRSCSIQFGPVIQQSHICESCHQDAQKYVDREPVA